MSTVQERLQLKRVPLDTWSTREQLCLAAAVLASGDQNWMSVSRTLKTIADPNAPPDWYSQKSCAAQYGALLENAETPKRKKRNSEGAAETPQESILKRLRQERMQEIEKAVEEMTRQYHTLKSEIAEIRNPATSEERLKEMWSAVEAASSARERESARRVAWLREREERRARAERTWRPNSTENPRPVTSQPSSPLLTSLLKSSPVVTTPQHISHPANVVDTVSPSACAPTLSMLLEKSTPERVPHDNKHAAIEHIKNTVSPSACAPTLSMLLEKSTPERVPHDNKHAAIEHIKSQLVQIEQQLIQASTSSPIRPVAPPPPPVDIDDIEIKAEDVYAFRDIDLHIPTHKLARNIEKQLNATEEQPSLLNESTDTSIEGNSTQPEPMQVDTVVTEESVEEIINVEAIQTSSLQIQPSTTEDIQRQPEVTPREPDVKISFPEVKFPTPEIKVIQADEIKEEIVPEPEMTQNVIDNSLNETTIEAPPSVEENITITDVEVEEETINVTVGEPETATDTTTVTMEQVTVDTEQNTSIQDDIVLQDSGEVTEQSEQPQQTEATTEVNTDNTTEQPVTEQTQQQVDSQGETEQPVATHESEQDAPAHDVKQELTSDDLTSQDGDAKDDLKLEETNTETDDDTPMETGKHDVKQELTSDDLTSQDGDAKDDLKLEETNTETDDDTPMEFPREEDKDGKKRRDYTRKKKPESRTCSGSESAAETDSPTPDTNKQHRLWKKSVMLVYSRLCAHKYASLFLRPICDEQAPGYSVVVKRPMDLSTIKKNIDNGVIRSTSEFHRDVLLMLTNALMYNSSRHRVHDCSKEMFKEAANELGMLLAAQAHAALDAPPAPRTRRHHNQ